VTAPWWAALPPVTAKTGCGGRTHTLRWAEGRLTAPDHPDAESELVLGALGGEQPRCIELVRAWGEHGDDLDALAIGPRTAADELDLPIEDPMPRGWASFGGAPIVRNVRGGQGGGFIRSSSATWRHGSSFAVSRIRSSGARRPDGPIDRRAAGPLAGRHLGARAGAGRRQARGRGHRGDMASRAGARGEAARRGAGSAGGGLH
jgi:hypothetical protein